MEEDIVLIRWSVFVHRSSVCFSNDDLKLVKTTTDKSFTICTFTYTTVKLDLIGWLNFENKTIAISYVKKCDVVIKYKTIKILCDKNCDTEYLYISCLNICCFSVPCHLFVCHPWCWVHCHSLSLYNIYLSVNVLCYIFLYINQKVLSIKLYLYIYISMFKVHKLQCTVYFTQIVYSDFKTTVAVTLIWFKLMLS